MNDTIKFQTDEHISLSVIKSLQRRVIDVLSTPQSRQLIINYVVISLAA